MSHFVSCGFSINSMDLSNKLQERAREEKKGYNRNSFGLWVIRNVKCNKKRIKMHALF